ncbi:hypothetical protein E2C01_027873 [Portunus trituberculatus]|uniref:Uncharacterized protein n=1 Tax=Portunus trituberculatus TaxID=210409 RepID=A0A5B7END7_PORTR|nr:hypothetical protein [Portunus trituberculatus]
MFSFSVLRMMTQAVTLEEKVAEDAPRILKAAPAHGVLKPVLAGYSERFSLSATLYVGQHRGVGGEGLLWIVQQGLESRHQHEAASSSIRRVGGQVRASSGLGSTPSAHHRQQRQDHHTRSSFSSLATMFRGFPI